MLFPSCSRVKAVACFESFILPKKVGVYNIITYFNQLYLALDNGGIQL